MMVKIALTSDLHYGHDGKTQSRLVRFFRKLRTEDFDVLIIAGDLISSSQKQLRPLYELIRTYIDVPVYVCYGNHDYWDYVPKKKLKYGKSKMTYEQVLEYRKSLHEEFEIDSADEGILHFDDVHILGFDGWYWHNDPPTKDRKMIVQSIRHADLFSCLSTKSYHDLDRILQYSFDGKTVCVTHFPPFTDQEKYKKHCANTNYLNFITEKFDVLCCGHSHRQEDFVVNGCRVLNCGSDYNQPKHIIFEL